MNVNTLEQLVKENPLDYNALNDLGIEYKRSGRHRDAILIYLNGVNAIFQNIYLQLKNNKSNNYFSNETLGPKAQYDFWLDRTFDCIIAYAKMDGIENVRFPNHQTAEKLSYASIYGSLFYFDSDNGKTRNILPNFINTIADCLTWNKIYSTYMNNIGVAYAEIGNKKVARKYFEEAIAFIPAGTNYPNPIFGLQQLDEL